MRFLNLFLAGLCCMAAGPTANAAAIATLTGIQSIDFVEGSGGSFTYNFAANSTVLTTQLTGALASGNRDFFGLNNESYDVFYSDANGALNALGEYISIEASFNSGSSSGLNIDSVRLNFAGGSTLFANIVPSFVSGTAYVAGSELNALGATNGLFTAMGRTTGADRLRVTVGFTPEPSSWALMGSALLAAGFTQRRRIIAPR